MNNDNWTTIDARSGDYTGLQLSSAQRRVLHAIWSKIPYFDFYGGPEEYEVKKFEVSQPGASDFDDLRRSRGGRVSCKPIFVYIVTGMRNDDGTMASVFCRKKRHLCIGPRGGISASSMDRKGFRSVSLFDAMNSEYWT